MGEAVKDELRGRGTAGHLRSMGAVVARRYAGEAGGTRATAGSTPE
jgi:hypothetical protein